MSRAEVIERRDALLQRLERFRDLADADLAGLLREELESLLERYDEIKRRHGQLDFVDLMVRTRDLLRRDRDVRRFFQERFTHIFVDEFQDTDPLQTEILLLLAADDADEVDWRRATPVPGQAVPGRRSQAVDLPVPPRRRRALPRGEARAGGARRRIGAARAELSRHGCRSRPRSTTRSRRR